MRVSHCHANNGRRVLSLAVALRLMFCLFVTLAHHRAHFLDLIPSGFHERFSSMAAVSAARIVSYRCE